MGGKWAHSTSAVEKAVAKKSTFLNQKTDPLFFSLSFSDYSPRFPLVSTTLFKNYLWFVVNYTPEKCVGFHC